MIRIDIDTDHLVKYTNKLEKLSKTAVATAIRNSLNKTALDVKQVAMPLTSSKEFVNRQKNFFKATSRVEFAKGSDINTMKSMVGFSDRNLSSGNKQAIEDLEQQEKGGTIEGRAFIPLKTARVGNSSNKLIKPNARVQKIPNLINARKQKGRTKQAKFINAVLKAGAGGFVLGSELKGETMLWKVNSLSSNLKTKKLDITPLYDYEKNRNVKVKATNFMEEASKMTVKKMGNIYMNEAEKLIQKALQ